MLLFQHASKLHSICPPRRRSVDPPGHATAHYMRQKKLQTLYYVNSIVCKVESTFCGEWLLCRVKLTLDPSGAGEDC